MNTFIRTITLSVLCLFLFCPTNSLFSSEEAKIQPGEDQPIELPNFQALFIKTMFLVGGLLLVTAGGLYLLKKTQARFSSVKGQEDIQILERRTLSPKTQLFLLSIKGKDTLIVESAHQVSVHQIQFPNETKEESI